MVLIGVLIYFFSLAARTGLQAMRAEALSPWLFTEACGRLLPSWFDRDGKLFLWDFWHALWGTLMVVCGTGVAYYAVRFGIAVILWGGLGGLIWWIGPRFTEYPNLDLVLWPSLGAVSQALAVIWALRWLRNAGHHVLACLISVSPTLLGCAAGILFVTLQLGPLAAYGAGVWLQLFCRWTTLMPG